MLDSIKQTYEQVEASASRLVHEALDSAPVKFVADNTAVVTVGSLLLTAGTVALARSLRGSRSAIAQVGNLSRGVGELSIDVRGANAVADRAELVAEDAAIPRMFGADWADRYEHTESGVEPHLALSSDEATSMLNSGALGAHFLDTDWIIDTSPEALARLKPTIAHQPDSEPMVELFRTGEPLDQYFGSGPKHAPMYSFDFFAAQSFRFTDPIAPMQISRPAFTVFENKGAIKGGTVSAERRAVPFLTVVSNSEPPAIELSKAAAKRTQFETADSVLPPSDHHAGSDAADKPKAPRLTNENNPATLLKQELYDFRDRISSLVHPGYSPQTFKSGAVVRYGQSVDDAKVALANRMLDLWHGTDTQPGMSLFTDAELATSEMTPTEVSKVRAAVRSNEDRLEWLGITKERTPSGDLPYVNYFLDNNQFRAAKERFFGLEGLHDRMKPPPRIYNFEPKGGLENADPKQPLDWFPHPETPMWASLYHGTGSSALPGMAREQALLSASEMKLRGVERTTGEGTAYTPLDVSMWKSFGRGFRNAQVFSSQTVEHFPMVVGVSRSVMEGASWGTMGGEVTVERMIPLDGHGVTHLYVPNREVIGVRNQLSSSGIDRVKVLGFSELTPPAWDINSVPKRSF